MFCLQARLQLTGYLENIPDLEYAIDWSALHNSPVACMSCHKIFLFDEDETELVMLDGADFIHCICWNCI